MDDRITDADRIRTTAPPYDYNRNVVDTPVTTAPITERRIESRPVEVADAEAAASSGRGFSSPLLHNDAEPPVGEPRFSLGATFLGWAVATFFSLLFLAIVAGLLGGNALSQYYAGDTTLDAADVNAYGLGALVGIVVATFLAFLIGGYAAGRISLWDGMKHGALIVIWPLLVGTIGFIVGASFGNEFLLATGVNIDLANLEGLTTGAVIGIVATLIAMLAGGALGGRFGERYHDHGVGMERRRTTARGRTF